MARKWIALTNNQPVQDTFRHLVHRKQTHTHTSSWRFLRRRLHLCLLFSSPLSPRFLSLLSTLYSLFSLFFSLWLCSWSRGARTHTHTHTDGIVRSGKALDGLSRYPNRVHGWTWFRPPTPVPTPYPSFNSVFQHWLAIDREQLQHHPPVPVWSCFKPILLKLIISRHNRGKN